MKRFEFSFEFLRKFLFSPKAGALIKIISWLCILGIGMGVGSLILVLSVMNGFNRSIRERKFSVEPHLVVYFDQMGLAEVENHPAVAWLRTQSEIQLDITETQDVILRSNDGFIQGAMAQGVSQSTLHHLYKQGDKKFIKKSDKVLVPGEVLVGSGLGDIMGLFEGDQIVVISPESLVAAKDGSKQLEMVKVKNFLHTEVEEIDTRKIFYEQGETLQRLRSTASLERTVELRIPDPENYEPLQEKLKSFGLRVDSWKDRNSNLFYSLKMEKFVVGMLLGLSTLIASFSLVTVMVLLITQKRKDIGLLLALGFEPKILRTVFVQVGVMLAGLGIFGGIFFGLLSSALVDKFSQGLLPSIYEETNIPSEIHWEQVIMVLVIAIVVSILTTALSVRKVSHLQPVDALRG